MRKLILLALLLLVACAPQEDFKITLVEEDFFTKEDIKEIKYSPGSKECLEGVGDCQVMIQLFLTDEASQKLLEGLQDSIIDKDGFLFKSLNIYFNGKSLDRVLLPPQAKKQTISSIVMDVESKGNGNERILRFIEFLD